MNDLYEFDRSFSKEIIGLDEAGRGPLAGPVVSGAVIISNYIEEFQEINDSKKLSEKKREKLFDLIIANCKIGIGIANEKEIDEINILNATFLSMRRALADLENDLDKPLSSYKVLVDGNHLIREYNKDQEYVIKGDSKSLAIGAASIIAKVTRDKIMLEYDKYYPDYLFAKHKGYGTKAHREAILELGPCNGHRKSFLKKILINK